MVMVVLVGGCAHEVRRVDRPSAPMPMLSGLPGTPANTLRLPWRLEGTPGPGPQLVIAVPGADCRKPPVSRSD